jgi:hypothetical protein
MQDFAQGLSEASEEFKMVALEPLRRENPTPVPVSTGPVVDFPVVPLYRCIASLVAEGKGPDHIAAILNIPEEKVRLLIKQPEVAKVLNSLPTVDQSKLVEAVLQGTVLDSICVLRDIRDNPSNTPSTRLTAAKELLDRALGRPEAFSKTKPLNSSNLPSDPAHKADYLDQEISRLLEQTGRTRRI